MGPLTGFRVIELAGIGPTPFGVMMLAVSQMQCYWRFFETALQS